MANSGAERLADGRRRWSRSLGPLSGRRHLNVESGTPRSLEDNPPPSLDLTLSPDEIGLLTQVLLDSQWLGALPYSGLSIEPEDHTSLVRISRRYPSVDSPVVVKGLLGKFDSGRRDLPAFLADNPIPEYSDSRLLIKVVGPVIPSPNGIKNVIKYYRLATKGLL